MELEPSLKSWALRVTASDIDEEQLKAWVLRYSKSEHWIVREGGDDECKKEHYHIWMVVSVSKQSLEKSLKKILNERGGNESKAFTDPRAKGYENPDRYYQYCMKGASKEAMPNVILDTRNRVKEAHEAYWTENARMQAAGKKSSERKTSTKIDRLIEEKVIMPGMDDKAVFYAIGRWALENRDTHVLSQLKHLYKIALVAISNNPRDKADSILDRLWCFE